MANSIKIPDEVRMMLLHGAVVEWLCKTENHHLIEPYREFEPRMIDFLLNEKTFVGKVKGCRDSEFYGIECLESDTQYGFFKDDNDVRPSSCTWIDTDKAGHLFKLFALKQKSEVKL